MATFKELGPDDIKTDRSALEQPVDIIQNDISSSSTRKSYQVWVTGGIGPGVTSSMVQTVFDQDFTLQTANPVFDITFGLSAESELVLSTTSSVDATTNKYYFPSQSIQMREKMDIYKTFAQNLLGNSEDEFTLVSGSTTNYIREPMFIAIKRIFARDKIKRETFAIKLFQTASHLLKQAENSVIFTDVGSSTNIEQTYGGQVSTIVNSSNSTYPVGLLYLDKGIIVLDTQRVFDTSTQFSGSIEAMSTSGTTPFTGSFNKFLVSASIDDICNHVCETRFSSSSETAMVFQNQTYLNSTIFFCRLTPDEFNYSSNPTYVDSNGRMVVIDPGQEETQRGFTFITSIGLYDANDNLLGIAKLSRPLYKDRARDIPVKIRIDF